MTNPSITRDERLRVRTLGFHIPRPGARAFPRDPVQRAPSAADVETAVRIAEPRASVRWFKLCVSRRVVVLAELFDGRHMVVKWPDDGLDQDTGRELEVFRLLDSLAVPAVTRVALPRVLAADARRHVAVYDAVHPATSLRSLFDQRAVTVGQVAALAAALAGLHRTSISDIAPARPDLLMPLPAPKDTLLTVCEYTHGVGMDFEQWLRVVQRAEDHLAALHAEWEPSSLIHFDLRDDNILFVADEDAGGPVRIIDWEFACLGDPAYDVAYVIAQFLLDAMRKPGPAGQLGLSLNVLRLLDAFLLTYHRVRGDGKRSDMKMVRYVGLILLQYAGSRLEHFGALGRLGYLAMVLADSLLRQPGLLVRHLGEGRADSV